VDARGKAKSEKRKAKSEKRKAKSEKQILRYAQDDRVEGWDDSERRGTAVASEVARRGMAWCGLHRRDALKRAPTCRGTGKGSGEVKVALRLGREPLVDEEIEFVA